MDYNNLGAAPDIDDLDVSKMDLGNELTAEQVIEPEQSQEELEQEVREANKPASKDEEAEDKDEPARDESGRFTKSEPKIPKSRFDEQVGKEREAREAAERRALEAERRLAESTANKSGAEELERIEAQMEELEVKYQELILDGNTAEAAKVMRQIRLAERQIATTEAESRAQATAVKAIEADRIEAAVARLESEYPEFNTQSESYDEDLVGLVLSKQRAFIQQGMTPSTALTKAGVEVASRFLKRDPEPAAKEQGLSAAKRDDRKKEAVAKAIDTQRAQAPSMKEVGMDSDKLGEKGLPDVTKMTSDEFDALPKATQDRLMGNLV